MFQFFFQPDIIQYRMPLAAKVIAIDPGHGGYDPGVFDHNVIEKEVNMAVALILREYLQQGGATVIMTREKDMDLLEVSKGPKKRLDMKNRLNIIEKSEANLLLSIHCNAIASPICSGAQTFYKEGDDEGMRLAGLIQKELIRVLENTNRPIKTGEYYLLENSSIAGAVVEVGFLSNPEEAILLKDPHYQKKVAWAIYGGVIKYFDNEP